ncbi:putative inorganic phosphate cotransporter isoform X1 [Macrobrachium nipponense]|uniref:putative inorganic phosphate cotransporter isoform X1 n=2 Tax=Macrobrachium nipponense TaxID=159736 RepID=UPI0030C83C9C
MDNYGIDNKGAEFTTEESNSNVNITPTLTSADIKKQQNDSLVTESRGWGARHTLCVMIFAACCVSFLSRVSLSIAIVAMVSHSSNATTLNSSVSDVCPLPNITDDDRSDFLEGEFEWDEPTQGLILGGFYYGYLVSNIFSGIVTEYLGGRLAMAIAVLGSSLLCLINPVCARISVGLFIAVRVLAGLLQGPLVSATFFLMASWIPPQEKAKLCSITLTGSSIGTVLSMALGGLMIGSNFLGGWPSVFYVFGVAGVLWTIPWLLLIHDSPDNHPSLSATELRYIKAQGSTLKGEKRIKIPWGKIATSLPFWSLMAVAWGNNFGFFNLLTEIPTYLKNIQHFGIQDNGLLSALPYIISTIFSICWGQFASFLLRKNALSIIQVRKLSSSIAMFGPALALITICFADCNSTLAVACLCISVGLNSASNSGADITEQEIAPNLTALLKSITNSIGSVAGILAPSITGAITAGNQTLSAWRTVFGISALTYVICCIIYLIFGTVEVQSWNEPKQKQKEKDRY